MTQTPLAQVTNNGYNATVELNRIGFKVFIRPTQCKIYLIFRRIQLDDDKILRPMREQSTLFAFKISSDADVSMNTQLLKRHSRLNLLLAKAIYNYQTFTYKDSDFDLVKQMIDGELNYGYQRDYMHLVWNILDEIHPIQSILFNDSYSKTLLFSGLYEMDIAIAPLKTERDFKRAQVIAILVETCAFPSDIGAMICNYADNYTVTLFKKKNKYPGVKCWQQAWIIHGVQESHSVDIQDESFPAFLCLMDDSMFDRRLLSKL
eukprot:321734_1